MRRRLPLLLAVSAALAAAAPAQACSDASWTAGTTELCSGTFTYRDYVYDDYGADRGTVARKNWPTLSAQAGDDRYPDELENSADLLGVELRIEGGRLHVRFPLSALYRGDETVAALAIDHTPGTGGGQWPGLNVRSDGWDTVHTFRSGDAQRNEITGDVPLPPGTTWRVQAVAAQADGTVMNVAFRGTNEGGNWWEAHQAAALASGDISEFSATVDPASLSDGVTKPAAPPAGLTERVYRSDFTLGEGYTYAGVPGRGGAGAVRFGHEYHFLGRHQPYAVYVPPSATAPFGIQLALHGHNANHASLIRGVGMQRNIGNARNRIVVVPLGRGPAGFYSDYSERDVLDVLADVERTYPTDPDRVFAGGYSMGGYGTLRLAALHPDRFAGYINWVGFTGNARNGTPLAPEGGTNGALGNALDFLGNLRHVPGANLYAGLDELVHAWTARELNRRFAALEIPYIYFMHRGAEHLTLAVMDEWRKESVYTKTLSRVHGPRRVTYRTQRLMWNEPLGLRHDRAYWVSGIEPAGDGFADVDLTTHGCGSSEPLTARRTASGDDPVAWQSEEAFVGYRRPHAPAPKLTGSLRGVSSVTVDAEDACLTGEPIQVAVTTDVPATLRLSDGRAFELSPQLPPF